MSSPNIAARNPLAYRSELKPVWCPGCGDYGVLASMYQALSRKKVPPEDVVIVAGIGCSGRLPGYVNAYGFHGVHGRTLPIATGVKLANPLLTVFAVGGDGDGLAIGGGHIPHAARRNVDITYLMMDNSIYAQTKGQSSPTTSRDSESASMPYGTVEDPLNPIAMAIAYGVSFVARGYAARSQQLVELISRGMDHKGFSFIHVISPCVTHLDTYRAMSAKVIDLEEFAPGHDPADKLSAFSLAQEEDRVPLGVFYQVEKAPFHERLAEIRRKAQPEGQSTVSDLMSRYR